MLYLDPFFLTRTPGGIAPRARKTILFSVFFNLFFGNAERMKMVFFLKKTHFNSSEGRVRMACVALLIVMTCRNLSKFWGGLGRGYKSFFKNF